MRRPRAPRWRLVLPKTFRWWKAQRALDAADRAYEHEDWRGGMYWELDALKWWPPEHAGHVPPPEEASVSVEDSEEFIRCVLCGVSIKARTDRSPRTAGLYCAVCDKL